MDLKGTQAISHVVFWLNYVPLWSIHHIAALPTHMAQVPGVGGGAALLLAHSMPHVTSATFTPQVPGGWAAQLYGGRITLIISFFLWSLVSMFTPTDARSTSAIMVARVAIGIAQGFIIPSV